jgi:hypothetical protein
VKTIRCLRPILDTGEIYLRRGETAIVAEAEAARLLAAGHVEIVPAAQPKTTAPKS